MLNSSTTSILLSMRFSSRGLVLVTSIYVFQATWAGISSAPLDLSENLKTSNDLPPDVPMEVEEDDFQSKDLAEITDINIENKLANGRRTACSVNIRYGLTDPQPVFLQTGAASFYPFSDTGHMQLESGKTMQMFCSSQFKKFAKRLITASCVSGTTFRVNGTSYKFSELICKTWPVFVVKKTGLACSGGSLLRVGFEVSPTRFAEQMQICFNEDEEVTRYVYHTLHPGSNYYQANVERITFQTDDFFGGKNVDKLYTQLTQQEIIDADLGGNGNKYFNSSKSIYLARGHLGAKADLMYGSQQRATFLFVNAAPQWQVFNAGNWARIEDGLRAWVSKTKIHVHCYTGVYGVTTLPDKQGRETPLYLARDANNNGLIPVPKLYFRVVIQPDTEKGIVFVGVNNPHLTLQQIKKAYIICNDVGDKVNYINWKRTDITAGYSYACNVSDFQKTVKTLPHLTANGGLLV